MKQVATRLISINFVQGNFHKIVNRHADLYFLKESKISSCLHIQGLELLKSEDFAVKFRQVDLPYVDGIGISLALKTLGISNIQPSPTTDLGWEIIKQIRILENRKLKLLLIGGEDELSASALNKFVELGFADSILSKAFNGFKFDVNLTLNHQYDIALIGQGMPKELTTAIELRDKNIAKLILTCGGWFGFITGAEKRAPRLLRNLRLEWFWRLIHSYNRLHKRYFVGLKNLLALCIVARKSTNKK